MNERDSIELYKKEIETFLSTLNIFKSKTIANIDENIKEKNVYIKDDAINKINIMSYFMDIGLYIIK